MNYLKVVRLCSRTSSVISPKFIGVNPPQTRTRQFSVDSIIRTQSGIFKSISESTPVEYFQKFILTVHDVTGLPWWATVICTTVFVRTSVTLPLAIYQHYILAKVENLHLEMAETVKELKKETAVAVHLYKWDERTTKFHFNRSFRKHWNDLIVRENCHPFKASLLIWFQLPMWVCLSVSFRNLVYQLPKGDFDAQVTFMELCIGGFGWMPNLVEVDSSLILPIALGIINLSIIEVQSLSKVRVPTKFHRYATNFFRGVSLIMVPLASSVPSCLALYWVTSSTYGFMQNIVLMSPKFRRFCKIPATASELERPYAHVLLGLRHKIDSIPGISRIKSL